MLGLDIGGANLKAVHLSGACRTVPFALWRSPGELAPRLGELVASLPPADALAVTMTGELCDCFARKRDGVEHILTAVESVARGRAVHVWLTTGRFADPADVRRSPLLAAASNWLALATWAGRLAASGPALLIDIGSTTADLVPLEDGRPTPLGRSDPERLKSRELVYTGVRRTPVCALLGPDGAAEWFATTQDVYLVLGETAEAPGDRDTADGRPATAEHAHARLARMVCADLETSSHEQRVALAKEVRGRQVDLLTRAGRTVLGRLEGPPDASGASFRAAAVARPPCELKTVLLAGSGEFLARSVAAGLGVPPSCAVVSLTERLGPEVSAAACAYAVAVLAKEMP